MRKKLLKIILLYPWFTTIIRKHGRTKVGVNIEAEVTTLDREHSCNKVGVTISGRKHGNTMVGARQLQVGSVVVLEKELYYLK